MTDVRTYIGSLVIVHCYKCHVPFGLTEDMHTRLKANGTEFFCPAGHPQAYVDSEVTRLKRQVLQQSARIDQLKSAVDTEKNNSAHYRRSAIAQRGVTTRLRKRAANGVCICCNRFFKNLADHMQSKHPEVLDAGHKPAQ